MDPNDLEATIADAASNPMLAEADGLKAQSHPLPDLIAADKYFSAKAAARQPHRGLRFNVITAPGPMGANDGGDD